MIGVGVIGYGYWGPNLVRNLAEMPEVRLVSVCDSNPQQLVKVQRRYPGLKTTVEAAELIADPAVDAVVIATPVSTHFELARSALRAGKHVLVEKPLAATCEQALRLIEEADTRDRVLMVDHTFIYTGAVRKIHELVRGAEFGEVYYYDSVRVNLGLFQHDVSVIWDLAVHDLSIMDYVLKVRPRAVSAMGKSHVAGQPENIAYLTLLFDGNLIAHVHVNWLAPVKLRRTLIGGSRRMIVYDDLEPSEKIKIYDRGITLSTDSEGVYRMRIGYRTGDMLSPHVELVEALRTELTHFCHCIQNQQRPESDGLAGLRTVRILEAATLSLAEQGRLVELDSLGAIA